jgi:hypothetical protein
VVPSHSRHSIRAGAPNRIDPIDCPAAGWRGDVESDGPERACRARRARRTAAVDRAGRGQEALAGIHDLAPGVDGRNLYAATGAWRLPLRA